MSMLVNPVIASCGRCPWEQARATKTEAEIAKQNHEHLRHGVPLPDRGLSGNGWQEQAVTALRQVAARGEEFRIYDALAEFGLANPPNHKTALGRLSSLLHDLHIAHPIRYEKSTRRGTKRSAAAVWHRDIRKCLDIKCQGKAAR